jgi:hypothetical protein
VLITAYNCKLPLVSTPSFRLSVLTVLVRDGLSEVGSYAITVKEYYKLSNRKNYKKGKVTPLQAARCGPEGG